MADLEIKVESLPERCEVCHQTDCFDPLTNYCTRCVGVDRSVPLQNPIKQELKYFWAVSLQKLIVMSVFTIGLYQFYWFYKNWDFINDRQKLRIKPIWRSIFRYIFCYSLFNRVRQAAREVNINTRISPALLTVAYIVLNIFERLPHPGIWISFLSILILLPVQNLINKIHKQVAPHSEINNRYLKANIVTIVIGAIFLLLGFIGMSDSNLNGERKVTLNRGEKIRRETYRGDSGNNSTLKEAAIRGYSGTVKRLIANGVNVNEKDSAGVRPLMYAAQTGHTDIVEMLYTAGAKANEKDINGLTALMHATINGDSKTVKLLLSIGAEANAKNKAGMSALNYAVEKLHTHIAKMLKTAGAKE
jgi:hypothetical protein